MSTILQERQDRLAHIFEQARRYDGAYDFQKVILNMPQGSPYPKKPAGGKKPKKPKGKS